MKKKQLKTKTIPKRILKKSSKIHVAKKTSPVAKKTSRRTKVSDESNAIEVIKGAVDKVLDKARQNFIGNINDSIRPLLSKFSTGLQNCLLEQCQIWSRNNIDNAIPVLPDNVKYYTKVGDNTVVVLEYKPQVRTLLMARALMDGVPKREDVTADDTLPQGIALALPYVIVTLTFFQDRFQNIYLNYANEPLNSLGDILCYPNLPNINKGDNKVCMGQIFTPSVIESLSRLPLTKQVNQIVSIFWLSNFNLDYTEYYKNIACNNEKMKTLRRWHESSLEDPLFVLKIRWQRHNTLRENIQRFIKDATAHTGINHTFQLEMEKALKAVTNELQKCFGESKDMIDPPNATVTSAIREKLQSAIDKAKAALDKALVELVREKEASNPS